MRVTTRQQQVRAHSAPDASLAAASELTKLLEPPFRLVEAAAPQERFSIASPQRAACTGSPEGQALVEALTRDGQATIDLSGLHVAARQVRW